MLSFVDVDALRPLRVVIDAANGMAGAMLPPVLDRLPMLEVVRCYFEPDGSFPNHEPNPLLPENREFIISKTREEGADFGVAYDGDADRCFFVDDAGEFVPGDFTTALFAESILAKEPGGKVIYDVRASWAVPEAIERAGGVALVNRVGHAFIKQRMREEDAVFARRGVGALLLPRLLAGRLGRRAVPADVRARLAARQAAARCSRRSARGTSSPARSTRRSPTSRRSSQELKERFGAEGRVSHLDGLSVESDDWHFNVRPSNTEPLLRLNLEARSRGADGAQARRGARA